MIDEEIPLHMLLNGDEHDMENEMNEDQLGEDAGNHFLQVGAVILRDKPPVFPTFQQQIIVEKEASEPWLTVTENIPGKKMAVSAQWAHFFSALLLSLANCKWVKSFIESEAQTVFSKSLTTAFIKILDQYPSTRLPCINRKHDALKTPLSSHEPNNINNQSDMSTPVEKKGKKKRTPLVESEMRRSPRLKEINKGFKADSCASKKCFACNPNPPDLSLEMIKKARYWTMQN